MFDGFLETWSVVGAETTGVGIERESVGEEIGLPVVVLVNLTVVGEGVSIKRVNMAGALRIHAGSIIFFLERRLFKMEVEPHKFYFYYQSVGYHRAAWLLKTRLKTLYCS